MKKRIRIIAVIGLVLLTSLTFISRSVYNRSLPQVTVHKIESTLVPLTIETTASLYYEDETVIKAGSDWKVSELIVRDGDKVSQGDLLVRFDTRDSDIQRMALELEVTRLTNALKGMYGTYRTETAASLKIAEAQLELFLTQSPPSDGLRAPCDGVVFGLSVKPGDTIKEGTEVLTLLPDAVPQLKFELPPKDGETFGPGAVVNGLLGVVISGEGEKDTFVRRAVTGKVSFGILKEGHWECIADLKAFEGRSVAGQEIPVKVVQQGEVQQLVVPVGCLFDAANNAKTVYVINTRAGLFGMESYLTAMPVQILYDNGKIASVSGEGLYIGMMLADTPSRQVEAGDTVWVRDDR